MDFLNKLFAKAFSKRRVQVLLLGFDAAGERLPHSYTLSLFSLDASFSVGHIFP